MKKHKPFQRSLALALSMAMVLGGIPIPVSANVLPSDSGKEITAFEPLAEEIEYQSVPIGTKVKDLNLPKKLIATVEVTTAGENPSEVVEEPVEAPTNETPTEGGSQESVETKEPQEPQESQSPQETEGSNESENPDATSSNALRVASVRVDSFDDSDTDITDIQESQVKEKTISIPVTWNADSEFESDVAGDYTFEPTIPDEYVIAAGVDLPTITVSVGNMMLRGNGWYKRTEVLDLTKSILVFQNGGGQKTGMNPLESEITITGEGWYWYLNGSEDYNYPEKTLLLDGINLDTEDFKSLVVPEGTTIILADGSSNFINNTYAYTPELSVGISGDSLTIAGGGELYVTLGSSSSYGSIGIDSNSDFTLEDSKVYIRFNNSSENNYTLLTQDGGSGFTVYQSSNGGEYNIEATWDEIQRKYTYNGGTAVTAVMLVNGTSLHPTATISDKTVVGRAGKMLTGENDVTISILNDSLIELQEDDNVSSWFSHLPIGLTATVKSFSPESVTIAFSGTPTVETNEVMNITIPSDHLLNGMLSVTVNNNAKFYITGISPRNSNLDLTKDELSYANTSGGIGYASPISGNITNTSEGWSWYLYGDEVAGYPGRTLVLDGLNLYGKIKLPSDTTILLADGSLSSAMEPENVIEGTQVTIKGSGELIVVGTSTEGTTGIRTNTLTIEDGIVRVSAPSATSGFIIQTSTLNITGGTLYAKSNSGGYAVGLLTMTPNKGLTVLQKADVDYSESVNLKYIGYCYTFFKGDGSKANDLKFTVEQPAPLATVENKVISGITNNALTGHDFITVSLENETYNNLNEGDVVSNWFQNLPKGITARLENNYSNKAVTIKFTGTPIKKSTEAMNIVIPAGNLAGSKALSVKANSEARFDIVEAGVRTTSLDLTSDTVWYRNTNGELVSKDPRRSDIDDTSEGWSWYRGHNDLLLDGINLITSDSVGVTVPNSTRVFLAENSDNNISVLDTNNEYAVKGIYGTENIEIQGNTGRLQVTAGNTKGFFSAGIHAIGNIYYYGGEVTAIGGDSSSRSFGIVSDSGISITGGTIYAKSGSITESDGIATAIRARYGITNEGMVVFQNVEGDYTEPAIVRNNGNTTCNYVFAGDNIASDLRITPQATINNIGGSANFTFNGTTIDLKQLSSLFTVDPNAGNRIYAVEEGGTGSGTISGNILTVTKAGTIRISLATEKTQTHPAGAKVFATLTVKKGEKTTSPAHLSVVNATKNGGDDGKITGLTPNTKYEYKKDGASYKEVIANERGEITGLSSGSYVVRIAENELYGASSDSLVIVIGQPDVDNGGNNGGNTGGNTGGNSGGDSDKDHGNSTTNNSSLPTQAVTGAAQNAAEVDSKGNAVVSVSDKNITDAIANARAIAAKKGVNAGEIAVSIHVTTGGQDASAVTVNLPKNIQQQVISNKISSVELMIDRPDITLGINLDAVTEIHKQANADVQLTAKKVDPSTLSGAAKNKIGSRPTYDLKASYEGGAKHVSNFGTGSVFVSIPYTPTSEEAIGGLYAVYVDEQGNPTRVEGSAYDRNSKSLIFKTNHFSVYGLGYESPATKLTDTIGNWAKDSIEYVVNRGLISGSSETVFAPEQAITRGVLATALSKLAGEDMKAVVQGKGNNQFAPEQAVTREEVAAILTDYAKATGYQLPQVRIAYAFSDGAKIETGYQEAVASMQKAGVIIGQEGSNFNPKANASRAEVSSMLHRYIKLTINPITTQNWVKNDSGQYMYFKEGKAVTDWQTIDGVRYYFESSGILKTGWVKDGQIWYYFNKDGSLARNTKVDGYEIDEKGIRK
jgi:hypothetical protein